MKRNVFGSAIFALLFASQSAMASAVLNSADASDFFAKHKAYVGWSYGDAPGFRLSGVYERRDKNGAVTKSYKIEERHRGLTVRELTAAPNGSVYEDGFTGTIAWSADDNGFVSPIYGPSGDTNAVFAGLYSEALGQLTATSLRKGTIDGVSYDIARVALPSKTPVEIYEDGATGAFRRIVVDPDGTPFSFDVDSYAELLPGKKMISGWHWTGSRNRTRYDAATVVTFADADLHPPAPRAHWTFGGGAVPVELTPYRILIHATINGVRGRFIFDTGASGIAVTGPFAAKAHLKHVDSTVAYGLSGAARATVDKADTIAFEDGSVLHDALVSTIAMDFGSDDPFDGLIGSGVLRGTIATLNLDTKQLTFDDPATNAVADSPGTIVAFVDLSDDTPTLPVKIDGNVPANALLDSGAPGYVLIAQSLQPRVPMLVDDSQLSSYGAVGGIGSGYELVRCGHVTSIAVGAIDYQNPNACFSQSVDGALIGFNFLTNFNLTFDYPAGKIIFQKRN